MYLFASLALFLYPVFVVGLFIALPPRRAIFIAYLVGWMYLPLFVINLPGLPDYGKTTATNLIVLPCIILFDLSRFSRLRFSWADLAVLAWVLVPLATSLSNGLGVYDGLSSAFDHLLRYGFPYVVGKLYLSSSQDLMEFRNVYVFMALSYFPLCLFEMRMSPQLHAIVYGFAGRPSFERVPIFGPLSYPPTVFMNSAFEVNFMVLIATIIVFCSCRTANPMRLHGFHAASLFVFLFLFSVLCKKWSGIGLLLMGLTAAKTRSRGILFGLAFFPILYMTLFISGIWRGEGLADWVRPFSERRADSIQFRIDNDNPLVQKALERPWLGWGGWGRNRVYNDEGNTGSVTDSHWMIILGVNGMIGLLSHFLIFAIPGFFFLSHFGPKTWDNSLSRLEFPLAIVLLLYSIDNLFNAFPNSMYPMFAGGLSCMGRRSGNSDQYDELAGT